MNDDVLIIAFINAAINHFLKILFSIFFKCEFFRFDVNHREVEITHKIFQKDVDNAKIEIEEKKIHAIEMTIILVVKKEKRTKFIEIVKFSLSRKMIKRVIININESFLIKYILKFVTVSTFFIVDFDIISFFLVENFVFSTIKNDITFFSVENFVFSTIKNDITFSFFFAEVSVFFTIKIVTSFIIKNQTIIVVAKNNFNECFYHDYQKIKTFDESLRCDFFAFMNFLKKQFKTLIEFTMSELMKIHFNLMRKFAKYLKHDDNNFVFHVFVHVFN